MSRHTVINPKTGRRVFKTGALGRAITSKAKCEKKHIKCENGKCKKAKTIKTIKKKEKNVKKKKGGPVPGKFYGYAGATKRSSPPLKTAGKTKHFCTRPSARALFDLGWEAGRTCVYDDKLHVLAIRTNGSPYWKLSN